MLARCLSESLQSLEAKPVTVEMDLAPGLRGIQLVGLADKAIQESQERVIEQRRLTTRSSLQLLRVARTIADLNGQDTVPTEAIADASGFRCTDLMGDHSAGAESR